ncbi:MAG: hypothetical protein EA398_08105 [Deltaproteobacteria bacterium]|nr:MAG: hypothetical protein EA398_08105 [Deltaproteobacteria bacterium]
MVLLSIVVSAQGAGHAVESVAIDPQPALVGQPITVTFPVVVPPEERVLGVTGADRRIVDDLDVEQLAGGIRWRIVIDRPGRFRLHALALQVLGEEGGRRLLELPGIEVTVESVLEEDADLIPRLSATLERLLRALPAWPVAAGGAALALLGWVAVRWWLRRPPPPPPPPIPAIEEAMQGIEALRQSPVGSIEERRAVLAGLSLVARQYLTRTLDVPARESTTAELTALLVGHGSEEDAAGLLGLLRQSDLVRFAGKDITAAATRQLLEDTGAMIRALHDAEERRRARVPEGGAP